ncbi:MAG TPA: hypothetical protein VEI95_09325, partial [Acidobacteriota bacterium]|nr:hypothetical protein [Acidobacteriota bacterium]
TLPHSPDPLDREPTAKHFFVTKSHDSHHGVSLDVTAIGCSIFTRLTVELEKDPSVSHHPFAWKITTRISSRIWNNACAIGIESQRRLSVLTRALEVVI